MKPYLKVILFSIFFIVTSIAIKADEVGVVGNNGSNNSQTNKDSKTNQQENIANNPANQGNSSNNSPNKLDNANTNNDVNSAQPSNKSNENEAKSESSGVKSAVDEENLNGYTEKQEPMGSVLSVSIMQTNDSNINLIFKVDKAFMAEVKILNFPFRLMIDIPMPYQWSVAHDDVKNNIPLSLIQGFRYGNPSKNVFRIVADLGRSLSINRSYVLQNADGTYNFIIEINLLTNPRGAVTISNSIVFSDNPEILKNISAIAEKREKDLKTSRNQSRISVKIKQYLDNVKYPKPVLEKSDRKIIVVLDPGHGGKDPGAISLDKSLVEKRIVLLVAKKLKDKLEENPDIAVVMTRNQDYYLPLQDRIFWSEYHRGDVFISLHADNSETSSVSSGLSIYSLSDVASDAQTQLLANNANKSDIAADVNLTNDDEEVNRILVSLAQRVRVNESISLSKNIIDFASKEVKILPNPIRSAGFAVLKIPNVPSILIELGFLSNADDVANFKKEDYLDSLANSISLGVQSFLWANDRFATIPKAILENASKPTK